MPIIWCLFVERWNVTQLVFVSGNNYIINVFFTFWQEGKTMPSFNRWLLTVIKHIAQNKIICLATEKKLSFQCNVFVTDQDQNGWLPLWSFITLIPGPEKCFGPGKDRWNPHTIHYWQTGLVGCSKGAWFFFDYGQCSLSEYFTKALLTVVITQHLWAAVAVPDMGYIARALQADGLWCRETGPHTR